MRTLLRRALVGGSVAWASLLPVAPFAAVQAPPAPFWYALAFLLYAAGSVICHQLPARSFFLWGAQLPVCARCTGIYVGAALAAVVVARRRRDAGGRGVDLSPEWVRTILSVAVVPTVLTLAYEWSGGLPPSNMIRACAGLPLGAAAAFIVTTSVR